MKKVHNTLTIAGEKSSHTQPLTRRLWLGLPFLSVLLGLWVMGQSLCPAHPLWFFAAAAAGLLVICMDWESRRQTAALTAVCAAGLILSIFLREPLTRGLAALYNGFRALLTERRGYYYLPYENAHWGGWAAAYASLLLGGITGAAMRKPLGHFLLAAPVLLTALFLFEGTPGWAFGLYLLGTLLLLVYRVSGGRALPAALVLAGLLAAPFALLPGDLPRTGAGEGLVSAAHRLRYESAENPLPEGRLDALSPFRPSHAPALQLQLEQWSAVYIRGFAGGDYTEEGWAQPAPNPGDYVLQKNGFYPAAERSLAGTAVGEQSKNSFSLDVLGACTAYAYVPYGAGGMTLDPCELKNGGVLPGQSLQGQLYDISDSYLVQAELAGGAGEQTYTDGEEAYREQVYAEYLSLPEEVCGLLSEHFSLPQEALTTSAARQQVLSWVRNTLTYDENGGFQGNSTDFLKNLLEVSPRGYSVHYATLATLLLRYCGIPARYAEGYLLTEREAQGLEPGAAVLLTQENAHAWTEFYLDGVGWLPFDTTPAHGEEITYELPPDGSGENGGAAPRPDNREEEKNTNIPIRQETREREGSDWSWLPRLLLGLVLLTVLALLLRTAVLRRRLKGELGGLAAEPVDSACLKGLRYLQRMLETMGLEENNLPLTALGEEIAGLLNLPQNQVEKVLELASRLSFSELPLGEADRRLVLEALEGVSACWKEKTRPIRRFCLRWVRCTIL